MNSDISGLASCFMMTGLGCYAYGSTKYRLPHAPIPFNSRRGWPWQHQDWFAPRGRKYRMAGMVFYSIAILVLLYGFVLAPR